LRFSCRSEGIKQRRWICSEGQAADWYGKWHCRGWHDDWTDRC